MLSLGSISKNFGTVQIGPISFDIDMGGYFVLLGPSGVGKTVLLEMIAGLIKPDTGSILFDGNDITSTPPELRQFSLLYQDYSLFPHLSVEKNIAYGLRVSNAKRKEIVARTNDLAEMLGIDHLLKRKPKNLSGGEQQRVALARALAPRPRLLLLDEPLAALDAGERIRLRKQLKNLSKELGITVLHVTHNPEESLALADRVAVMIDHTIAQIAEPDELFRKPSNSVVANFLGISNILPVDSFDGDTCSVAGQKIHASGADGSTSYLWIGPEEILLSKTPFSSSARNQFECTVGGHDNRNVLLAVDLKCGNMLLTALITHRSFIDLGLSDGSKIFATFKSSAVHCF